MVLNIIDVSSTICKTFINEHLHNITIYIIPYVYIEIKKSRLTHD